MSLPKLGRIFAASLAIVSLSLNIPITNPTALAAETADEAEKVLSVLDEAPSKTSRYASRLSGTAATQERQESQAQSTRTQTQPTRVQPRQVRPNKIMDVEVRGNRIISTPTVLSKIQSRKGAPLVQDTINEDVKRLYASGYFEDIRVELEEKPSGYLLIISVVEKPIIREIKFEGFSIFKIDRLQKDLAVIEGQILDRQAIKQGVEAIRKRYRDKGFGFAEVESYVDIDRLSREASVTITITEGEKYKIDSIELQGVESLEEKKVRKAIRTKTRNPWLFRSGVFNDEKFRKDIENIRLLYQQEGYLDVKVSPEFDYDKESHEIHITIGVEEGKHYITGEIDIKGSRLFPESEIWQALEMLPGMTYSQFYLAKDVESIREFYYSRGYMDARVIPDIELNRDTGKVDVSYQIEEGDLYFVEKVLVRGNTKTKDIVIRRELRIRPGERFNGESIDKSIQRLENLNFFEEITYDTAPSKSADNRKDLIFRVKEKRTGELSFGGGVSSVDAFVGFAQISQRNFDLLNFPRFTGDGQSVSLSARVGTISQNFNFNFQEPYLFDRPISFGLDLFNIKHDDRNLDFDQERRGGGITLAKTFKDVWKVGTGYTLERVELDDISDDAPSTVRNFSGVNWLSRVRLFGSHDTRDNVWNPSKGHLATINTDFVGSFLGGNQDFYVVQASYSQYWRLFKKHLLETRVRLGTSQEFGQSDEVPIFDRFYAGGLGSVRGYNFRRVGPIEAGDAIGGQTIAVWNIEYTFPLPYLEEAFRGAFFIDTGHVNEDAYKIEPGDFAVSVGPGVKVKTPIGPLAFYYGLPIANKDTEDENGRFEFSLSRGF